MKISPEKVIMFPLTRIILGGLICFFIPFLFKEWISKPLLELIFDSRVIAKSIQHSFSIIVLIATYSFVFKWYEKRPIDELKPKYMLKELTSGFGLGVLFISAIFLCISILGYYKIISFEGFSVLVLPFITLAVLALSEELFFRGILYRILEQWLGTIIALIIPSLIFGLVHIPNENITGLGILGATIGGLLMGIMYTYTKRLWLPLSFHFGWNFTQLIFGTNVSGIKEFGVLFKSELKGPILLVGSQFGIEDSIFALLFTVLLFTYIYYKSNKKGLIQPGFWQTK